MSRFVMVWSILGCFGMGESTPSLDRSAEPSVVLADAGIIFGGDGAIAGWKVDEKTATRFSPTGPGSIVAADMKADGIIAVAAQKNGTNPQLWTHTEDGWTPGPSLAHGPINQIMVAQDGCLWTEGDKGLYRSSDAGETWTRMDVSANLRLGSVKLGQSGARIAFAGRTLVTTTDNGTTWTTVLDDGSAQATDGTWVAASTPKPSLRVGRITDASVVWTAEIDGDWNVATIRSKTDGVRIVGTQKMSTQVELLEGPANGTDFSRTRLDTQPEWVGLGERVMWVDRDRRIFFR